MADAPNLQNPTLGTVKLKNNTNSTTAVKITVQDADGSLNFRDKEILTENSAGAISGFAITNNGNGTVNIASGFALLRATNDENGILQKYFIPAVTNLALTDNVNNYVIVQYNGGTPNMAVITDSNLITTTDNTLIYVIARYGTTINYLYTGEQNVDSNGKLRRRFLNVEPIKRAAGAVIGFTNRTINTTAGLFYGGLTPYTTPLLGATFTNAYNNGSVWTRQTAQTQVNNTQYNLNGVLTSMTNGRFRTDFVYIMVNNPSVLYTVMGTSQANTLADARLVPLPSALPVELQRLGVLVGRLIIGTNNASITEVSSAYDITFNASTVINHNDTGNIQGGAVGDYLHVTTAEKATWNAKLNSANPTTSGVVTFGSDPLPPVSSYELLTRNTATGILSKISSSTYRLFSDDVDWTEIANKPSTFPPSPHIHPISDITGLQTALNGKQATISGTANFLTKFGVGGVVQSSIFDTGEGIEINSTGLQSANIILKDNNVNKWVFGSNAGALSNDFNIYNFTLSKVLLSLKETTGNLLVNTTTDNGVDKLQVNGSGYFSEGIKIPSSNNLILGTEGSSNFLRLIAVAGGSFIQYPSSAVDGSRGRLAFTGLNGTNETMVLNADGSVNINGTISASPATTANQVVVKSQLDAVGRPYKVYTALLTQTGTNAPTAIVLENTLGGTVVFTYNSVGFYTATLSGVFTANKTYITWNLGRSTAAVRVLRATRLNGSDINLQTWDSSLTPQNGIIDSDSTFEIRVYN